MKAKLITSRKWHSPQINTFVSSEEVGSSIELDDFFTAVVEEIGNPTMILTKAALKAKLSEASIAVLHELRQATTYVV